MTPHSPDQPPGCLAFDLPTGSPLYSIAMIVALGIGAAFWMRKSRDDYRVAFIYLAAIGGAFLGAKIAYLVSEGWLHVHSDHRWLHWLTGKSVTGALLGGWIGVEVCKKVVGYRQATGDHYALLVPIGLIIGRLGCLSHGCCPGIECDLGALSLHDAQGAARWPAVPVEILFNLLCLAGVVMMRRARLLPGQHFHLYLFAYGLFRFGHEFLRDTPKAFGGVSGYQFIALILAASAAAAFILRARRNEGAPTAPAPTTP